MNNIINGFKFRYAEDEERHDQNLDWYLEAGGIIINLSLQLLLDK